jgi:hypothetical protein
MPKPDANGRPVRPATRPACVACADNTVSGPDAPAVDWAALGFKRDARGPRPMGPSGAGPRGPSGAGAGAAGALHPFGWGPRNAAMFCVPCPAGTSAKNGAKCA